MPQSTGCSPAGRGRTSRKSDAEPIYREASYPVGAGPFPIVAALHASGGFKSVQYQIAEYTNAGYAAYAPDLLRRHGLTSSNRSRRGPLAERRLKPSC